MAEITGRFREIARLRLAERAPVPLPLGDWMPASVLILLYPRDGHESVLLTVRSELVEHHKGQISFPGGATDEDDASAEATALRETFEEVGVPPHEVEVLGRLDDVRTVSSYRVTPVVGAMDRAPRGFTPSPYEVAEVLEIPIFHLLDPAHQIEERRERDGTIRIAPSFEYNAYRVWGVTARILDNFLSLFRAEH
jgi:8-oxo-dGTP pyrophosphatase MutT (NUDIX family)